MARHYLLMGNPTARSGKGRERIDRVLAAMGQAGLAVDFEATLPDGATVPLVSRLVNGGNHDVVVYVGGDGTFAEVAKGLLRARRRVPLGLMPSGTANDQGQSFGLGSTDADIERNVAHLVAHHTTAMDVGRLSRIAEDGQTSHTDLWFDNIGFGVAPAILSRRNRDRHTVGHIPVLRDLYRDQAVYMGAALAEALRSYVEPVKFSAELVIDGQRASLRGLTDIVINNTAVYGGEWIPVRTARADDGFLDLAVLQGRRDTVRKLVRDHKLAALFPPELEPTRTWRAATCDRALPQPRGGEVGSQIDGGEWHAGTHFLVETLPGALPVIVPARFVPPWHP